MVDGDGNLLPLLKIIQIDLKMDFKGKLPTPLLMVSEEGKYI
ncbi:hypothetical protein IC582_002036 [Cucumis melo]